MTKTLTKPELLSDLRERIHEHHETVADVFQPLDAGKLNWQDCRKEWSITQCFDHAVLDIYLMKQDGLSEILDQVGEIDLGRTPVTLEKGIKFNLGIV